jgi:hypothetical protein
MISNRDYHQTGIPMKKRTRRKPMVAIDPNDLDAGICDAVLLLREAGFKTFTSCEGGWGHSFRHETIGLELDGDYRSFQKKIVQFLRSQGMENFTISLVTDYPKGKSVVYVEGLDLLSSDKRRRVIQAVRRKERRLRGGLGM